MNRIRSAFGSGPRRLAGVLLLLAFVPFQAGQSAPLDPATAGERLMAQVRIGGLRLGQPQASLPARPGCKLKKAQEILWGADGLYHQDWEYIGCGLVLNLASEKAGGAKTVFSITLKAPSSLATEKGIRVGSSVSQAMQAYGPAYNPEDSISGKSLVFGSIYGGLVLFLRKGKVYELFLGSLAE
jgi:hypothetical protein